MCRLRFHPLKIDPSRLIHRNNRQKQMRMSQIEQEHSQSGPRLRAETIRCEHSGESMRASHYLRCPWCKCPDSRSRWTNRCKSCYTRVRICWEGTIEYSLEHHLN